MGKLGAGHRPAAERAAVRRFVGRQQPLRIPHQVVVNRHQIMAQRGRLRMQQVRVAGHDRFGLGVGALEQGLPGLEHVLQHAQQPLAQDHAMERLGPRAAEIEIAHHRFATRDARHQRAFHVQIIILHRAIKWPQRIRPGLFQLIERPKNRRRVLLRHQLALGQHEQPRAMRVEQWIEVVPAVELKDGLENVRGVNGMSRSAHALARGRGRLFHVGNCTEP